MAEKKLYATLPKRGLITITGKDRLSFLQALITNDVELLKQQASIYACLLTAQGKFLYDFFVIGGHAHLTLECEGGARAHDLYERLTRYKLRADVSLSIEDNTDIYAGFDNLKTPSVYHDPRHADMGWRSFAPPEGYSEMKFSYWDIHRLKLGIPDGSRDMIPEQSTLLECHIDKFNGLSYEKGCYIGQELTARMHYRGLAKKHLYPVTGSLPNFGMAITSREGKHIGEMRSSCEGYGLALLKDVNLSLLENSGISVL